MAVILLIVGMILFVAGVWLTRRYSAAANYRGIGNPYGYQGLWATLGGLVAIAGFILALIGAVGVLYP